MNMPTIPFTVDVSSISARLYQDFQPVSIEVIDESGQHIGHAGANGTGQGTHFRVRLVSNKFNGLGRVARHRLVYDSLRLHFDAGLHALVIEALDAPQTQTQTFESTP